MEAELDRRYPDRVKMRPAGADGFREAWDILERLAGRTEPVTGPGYPGPESFPVRRCLRAVLSEEWEHRLYAERDLGLLQAPPA